MPKTQIDSKQIRDSTVDSIDISNKAITLEKMNDVASGTVFYRKTAGDGNPEVQTLDTLKTDLNVVPSGGGGAVGFTVDGALAVADDVSPAIVITAGTIIDSWYFYLDGTGFSGSSIFDTTLNGGTSIFQDMTYDFRPVIQWDDTDGWVKVTNPLITDFVEGDILTLNIDQVAVAASGLTVISNGIYGSGGTGGGSWGSITGTLSNQTDIQSALDNKVTKNITIVGDTKTKITYDSKGLVASGVAATQDDIGDGSTYKQFSSTEKTKLSGIATNANNYSHPNHTGDVTSTGDGATVIGASKVTEAMQVLADNTTNNASTTKHGYLKKLPNVATQFINGVGNWAVPGGESSRIVQVVHTQTGSLLTGTTILPFDDTIPQNTEGDEYLSLAITPTNVNNSLLIEGVLNCSHSATGNIAVALFQDATAGALACVAEYNETVSVVSTPFVIKYKMAAGTVSATTFKVRAGNSGSGTLSVNGSNGLRRYGGVMMSSLTITEILA